MFVGDEFIQQTLFSSGAGNEFIDKEAAEKSRVDSEVEAYKLELW